MFGLVYSWHAESRYRTWHGVPWFPHLVGVGLLCVTVVHFKVIECMCIALV